MLEWATVVTINFGTILSRFLHLLWVKVVQKFYLYFFVTPSATVMVRWNYAPYSHHEHCSLDMWRITRPSTTLVMWFMNFLAAATACMWAELHNVYISEWRSTSHIHSCVQSSWEDLRQINQRRPRGRAYPPSASILRGAHRVRLITTQITSQYWPAVEPRSTYKCWRPCTLKPLHPIYACKRRWYIAFYCLKGRFNFTRTFSHFSHLLIGKCDFP